MVEEFYLLSKDIGQGPHLLGKLTRLSKGEYQFRYMIRGSSFPEWFMGIPDMRNIGRVYETEEVKNKIIHRVIPREGTFHALGMMEQNNMREYDEWDLLNAQIDFYETVRKDKFPLSDSHQYFYFYKEMPRKVNRYD